MSDKKARVVAVGEVMVELARGADNRYGLSFGGDTFNTAVYLARAGLDVAFATALGDDSYSDAILALATAEGIKTFEQAIHQRIPMGHRGVPDDLVGLVVYLASDASHYVTGQVIAHDGGWDGAVV